jgi:hypothetical protein
MTPPDFQQQSHLFTVRLWPEIIDDEHFEWRGRVCHVVTQEEHYFRDWAMLMHFLQEMLPPAPSGLQPPPAQEGNSPSSDASSDRSQ